MKFSFSRLLVFAIASILLIAQPVSAQVVEIPDPNLRNTVREALETATRCPYYSIGDATSTTTQRMESKHQRPFRT